MIVRSIIERLFKKKNDDKRDGHLHSHAHVAEVYKCRCGHIEVRERR